MIVPPKPPFKAVKPIRITLERWRWSQSEAFAGLLAATPAAKQIRAAGKAIHGAPAGQ
jgi:hypothetical protein